jgi:hypothetical protein
MTFALHFLIPPLICPQCISTNSKNALSPDSSHILSELLIEEENTDYRQGKLQNAKLHFLYCSGSATAWPDSHPYK